MDSDSIDFLVLDFYLVSKVLLKIMFPYFRNQSITEITEIFSLALKNWQCRQQLNTSPYVKLAALVSLFYL